MDGSYVMAGTSRSAMNPRARLVAEQVTSFARDQLSCERSLVQVMPPGRMTEHQDQTHQDQVRERLRVD